MNVRIFGWIALLSLACNVAPLVARGDAGAVKPLVSQSFDGQIPGDFPDGWHKFWGDQGDDLVAVSNIHSASGKNSLMLDRETGANMAQWGFGRAFPDIKSGWCVISFAFLVDGAGSNTAIGIEIRPAGGPFERCLSAGIGRLKVDINSPDWSHKTEVGSYEPGKWQRLTLWTPTREDKQTAAYAVLETQDRSGEWKISGPAATVPARPFDKEYGYLLVNVAPNTRGFKLYIDDVTVEQRFGQHP